MDEKRDISLGMFDEYVQVFVFSNTVFLRVEKTGFNVDDCFNEIISKLNNENIVDIQLDKILECLQNVDIVVDLKNVAVAEISVPTEPKLTVLMEKNLMEASLLIVGDESSRLVSYEDVITAIEKSGVTYGINYEYLQDAKNLKLNQKILIAEGLKPEQGKDSYLHYYVEVDLDKVLRPKEREDGSVDFKSMTSFTEVEPGDIVAENIPATKGKDGIDVRGNILKAKDGRDLPVLLGSKNLVLEDNKVIAQEAGTVHMINGKLSIKPKIEITGDVGVATGNLTLNGDITIMGSVLNGYQVKTLGDIYVKGGVYGGRVEGHNVIVDKGISGKEMGAIKATGNLQTLYIENSILEVDGNIFVKEAILNSEVKSGGSIFVGTSTEKGTPTGGKGLIAGGIVAAAELVDSKFIGTRVAQPTVIEVGDNPMIKKEYRELTINMEAMVATLEQTKKTLAMFNEIGVSNLPPTKKEIFLKLTRTQFKLSGDIESGKKRKTQLESLLNSNVNAKIKCKEMVYPGVKVVVGNLKKIILEPQTYLSIMELESEIIFTPYN